MFDIIAEKKWQYTVAFHSKSAYKSPSHDVLIWRVNICSYVPWR